MHKRRKEKLQEQVLISWKKEKQTKTKWIKRENISTQSRVKERDITIYIHL